MNTISYEKRLFAELGPWGELDKAMPEMPFELIGIIGQYASNWLAMGGKIYYWGVVKTAWENQNFIWLIDPVTQVSVVARVPTSVFTTLKHDLDERDLSRRYWINNASWGFCDGFQPFQGQPELKDAQLSLRGGSTLTPEVSLDFVLRSDTDEIPFTCCYGNSYHENGAFFNSVRGQSVTIGIKTPIGDNFLLLDKDLNRVRFYSGGVTIEARTDPADFLLIVNVSVHHQRVQYALDVVDGRWVVADTLVPFYQAYRHDEMLTSLSANNKSRLTFAMNVASHDVLRPITGIQAAFRGGMSVDSLVPGGHLDLEALRALVESFTE